jgi:phospholipid/cholesterol/gamma-HCH transport system ATP-binding protein
MSAAMRNESREPVVEVRDLRKSFGNQVVLNGVNLTVRKGETLAVLGRSGTGKSVLLKLVIGLQRQDSGSIRIEQQEITDLDTTRLNEVRKKVGFLFQQAALYDSLTVEENVAFPLRRHCKLSDRDLKSRVRELLALSGMDNDLEKMPSELSGGMQKRVGLARALALDPIVLLFDEPTAGLDPITAAEIARLIVDLKRRREITSMVVTHDLHAAKIFADRMVLMNDGVIQIDGTLEDLQRSKDQFVSKFVKEAA